MRKLPILFDNLFKYLVVESKTMIPISNSLVPQTVENQYLVLELVLIFNIGSFLYALS
jgi:hypothetical protein